METLNMIKSRQAIRNYSGQVEDGQLQNILMAANAGPVGMGQFENYRITVIQDSKILGQMSGIYDAPTVIVISASKNSPMEYVSAGAIVHGMELAAEDQGVGANYNMACLSSIPSGVIPNGYTPLFALTLGQTEEIFEPKLISLDKIETDILK